MSSFSLDTWTACQDCTGYTFAYAIINNNRSSSKTARILIGADQNSDGHWEVVGADDITIKAYSSNTILIDTNLEPDYTGKIQIACYYDGNLEFSNTKSGQEFEPYGRCPTQEKVSNLVAQCKQDGSAHITWDKVSDAFIYDIFRYKNNVIDTYFETKNNYFTDDISNCSSSYSYGIEAVSKCLRVSPEVKVTVIAYDVPCPIPICNFIIS